MLMMKYYIRVCMLIYVVLLTCVVFWWRSYKPDTTPCDIIARESRNHRARKGGADNFYVDTDTVEEPMDQNPYLNRFYENCESSCDGSFKGYSGLFAKLKNVILDIKFGRGKVGGENISEVLNQKELDEFFELEYGFFRLHCEAAVKYRFIGETHLNKWLKALHTGPIYSKSISRHAGWTVAITRYEYANLYHTMTDYYNAFLVLKAFSLDPRNVTILWVDGHPKGALDEPWFKLFGKVIRIGEFKKPVMFENMIWGIVGYESPLDEHFLPSVPFLEEFRELFLSAYDVMTNYDVKCDKLNILVIWRHDYLAHPRNPSGTVSRKIKNEQELLDKIKETLPEDEITDIQIDLLPMKQQLELISKTDILVGMHGAGLSHTLFLPRHAGLVELFPAYYSNENRHFRAMSEWRHLRYGSWANYDIARETNDQFTVVDVEAVVNQILTVKSKIC